MRLFAASFLLLALVMTACKKENKLSKIPSITFLSAAPNTVKQGSATDTCWISFKFEDGDADINTTGDTTNIFIKDLRPGVNQTFKYGFPPIPDGFKDPAYGFKGTCIVGIDGTSLHFRDTVAHKEKDTISYEVFILDEAGHESNHITTSEVYLTQ